MSGEDRRGGIARLFRLDLRSPARAVADADEELASFLDARVEDLIALGMTPMAARKEALVRLGGASLEDTRAALNRSAKLRDNRLRIRDTLGDLRADVRVASRTLWRERGYAFVVAVTLALGIGGASATFAAIKHVLLEPLPVRDQGSLAVLTVENTASLDPHVGITYQLLSDLQSHSHAITAIAGVPAALAAAPYAARDDDRVVQLALTGTTANFFEVLGAIAQQGRLLEADDESGARGAVAVLSYSAWRTKFGGRADIVGHHVTFNVGTFEIVGVAQADFDYPRGTDIWVADAEFLRLAGYSVKPEDGFWNALVRLRSHDALDEASSELMARVKSSTAPLLGPVGTRHVLAHSYSDVVVGDQRNALVLFAVAVALLLIVACTNIAGLLLARGLSQARDVAVRKALGATTRRIVRQLMVENLLLSGFGFVLGIAIARILLSILVARAPAELARMDEIGVDIGVAGFALVLSLLSVIAFALAPALSTASSELDAPLRSGGRSQSANARAVCVRQWLVTGQVALCVVMLTSAGLLLRNLSRLQHLQLGFDPSHLLFVFVEQLDPNGADMNTSAARHTAVISGLVERLQGMPGVVNATSVFALPFSVIAGTGGLEVHYGLEGQSYSAAMTSPTAGFNVASKDYFATLRISLLGGRIFSPSDRTGNPQVAIVSQAFAKRAWPGGNPIGRQIRFVNDGAVGLWRTVVGVVADTKYHDFLTERPEVYIPLYQTGPGTFIAVRTAGDPLTVVPLARDALRGLDQGYGIAKSVSADQLLGARLARPRFIAVAVVVLAATVAVLAAVGLFGVLSFTINQRRHEFGIRLALGASAENLRSLVLRNVVRLTIIGVTFGFAIGLPAATILRHEIVGVSIYDPLSLTTVLLVVIATIVAASALPVVRVANVNPVTALRE